MRRCSRLGGRRWDLVGSEHHRLQGRVREGDDGIHAIGDGPRMGVDGETASGYPWFGIPLRVACLEACMSTSGTMVFCRELHLSFHHTYSTLLTL